MPKAKKPKQKKAPARTQRSRPAPSRAKPMRPAPSPRAQPALPPARKIVSSSPTIPPVLLPPPKPAAALPSKPAAAPSSAPPLYAPPAPRQPAQEPEEKELRPRIVSSMEKRELLLEDHKPLERFGEAIVYSTLPVALIFTLLYVFKFNLFTTITVAVLAWVILAVLLLAFKKKSLR